MGLIIGLMDVAAAQIVPDRTLRAEGSRVAPGTVNGQTVDRIEGGAQRGQNLFHSFQEFNIGEGQRVYFANPANVRNILTRVTGNNLTDIQGTLGVEGGANLFLMNPHGIVFGRNARLDIRGSFLATTANSFHFSDGNQFSAINPQGTFLLSISVPTGLQYGMQPAGPIRSQAALVVNAGRSLVLAGGDITLDDTLLAVDSVEEGGRIELGATAGTGIVELTATGNLLSLNFPNKLARANVSLVGSALLVSAANSGSIAISANNLDILGESELRAGIAPGLGSVSSQAGDIAINATGAVRIAESNILNSVRSGAVGRAGNIDITANSLSLTNSARLQTSTFGQGDAGNVRVAANDFISLADGAIFSTVEQGAVGNSGNINITSSSLSAVDGSQFLTLVRPASDTLPGGRGNGGNVDINVHNAVVFAGAGSEFFTGVSSVLDRGTTGSSGNIHIRAGSLSLTEGARLRTNTSGQGDAGTITLEVNGSVTIDGLDQDGSAGGVFSSVQPAGIGNAGDITITSGSFSLSNGDQLIAGTRGQGNAGNIFLQADNFISLAGSRTNIFSNVDISSAVGNGGSIDLRAGSLSITGGAQLLTNTRGRGSAGDIVIQVRGPVSLDGVDSRGFSSVITSSVDPGATGNGGGINIEAGSLSLTNGAQLNSSTKGQGSAGNVLIRADRIISLDGVSSNRNRISSIFSDVDTNIRGDGGNINIEAESLSLTDRAQLRASSRGQGDAGNIIINTQERVSFDNSNVLSNLSNGGIGQGGDIRITTRFFSLTNGSQVGAVTQGQGNAGNVFIHARDQVSSDGSNIFSSVEETGIGQGGDIRITTGSFLLNNGSQLSAATQGRGDAGNVGIQARGRIFFNGESAAFSVVDETGIGKGGTIRITAGSLFLTNGSQLTASTFGQGNAGNVIINARDIVALDGVGRNGFSSGISTSTGSQRGQGGGIRVNTVSFQITNGAIVDARTTSRRAGGRININANSIEVTNGGQVITTTRSSGRAGDIDLNVAGSIILSGNGSTYGERLERFGRDVVFNEGASSGLFASTASNTTGRGGDISIVARELNIQDQARIAVNSQGTGQAGNLQVMADSVSLNQGRLRADTLFSQGGNIRLNIADSLQLNQGSQITASTRTGRGGDVRVSSGNVIELRNRGQISAEATGNGTAGSLDINTAELNLNNADATVSSEQGRAGNLTVTADTVRLNHARLTATTRRNGDGANIQLRDLDLLLMENDSRINSDAGSQANGGNIGIESQFIAATPLEDNDITANAGAGDGGRVNITTEGVFGIEIQPELTPRSDITATSEQGVQGIVAIDQPETDPARGLTSLPTIPLDATTQIASVCPTNTQQADRLGSFIVSGRGGLPANPVDLLSEDNVLTEWVTTSEPGNVRAEPPAPAPPIVEAQGWVVNPQGKVTLVAPATPSAAVQCQ